ncbi:MAG: rhodanese-like domain-containing protein, partial [Nitrososphaeraceae archaeon]|nr:rhodanese-like domain-containing protein [Nitrososphaeraceae archaeon]
MNEKISMSPSTLSKLIENKELFLLFDLRSQEKYNQSHITGASHAVCDANTKETIMPKIPKNIKIILVDDDGTISKETAEMMSSMQFDSYYLDGGMKNWNGNITSGSISDAISSIDLWKKLNDK